MATFLEAKALVESKMLGWKNGGVEDSDLPAVA
jgi:hypothetical protein